MSTAEPTILVTGGTGFLGSYLIRHLIRQGVQNIRAIHRSSSKMDYVTDIQDQIQWFEADLTDIQSLENALDGIKQVYHVAALVSMNPKDEAKMLQINHEGTAHLLNLSLEIGIEKFLHVSSVAVFGRTPDGHIEEGDPWAPYEPVTAYGRSKQRAESEVWRAIAEGLNAVIVNPSTILGAGDWNDPSLAFFRLGHQGASFYPKGTSGFVDVRDAARFMAELMASDLSKDRFIINAENILFREVMSMIAQEFGKKPPTIQIGKGIQRIYSWWDYLQSRLTGAPHIVTSDTVRMAGSHTFYQNKKGVEALQFDYQSISETIRESCALFKQFEDENQAIPILPVQ